MAIHEAWLFEDDSILVKFENGCLLQLSSCGAVFRCFSPADNPVTSRSACLSDGMQQYSRFATTMWKDMVKQAVNFRNRFACYPYVCPNLSEIIPAAEVMVSHNMNFHLLRNHSKILRMCSVFRCMKYKVGHLLK